MQAMGWVATKAGIMDPEVMQTMVDEGGESASTTLGVDLGELQMAILGAAHAVSGTWWWMHRWHWTISWGSCNRGGQQ